MPAIQPQMLQPLINPVTGAVVDIDSIDSVIEHYKEANDISREVGRFKDVCRSLLQQKTESNGSKTHHVLGSRWRATVVESDPSPSTSVLRQLVNQYPSMAPRYIVPSGYRIDKRQYKVMQNSTSDNPQFNALKQQIESAIATAPEPKPSITKIERI